MKTKLDVTEIVASTVTINCLLSLNGKFTILNYIQIPLTIIMDVLVIWIYYKNRKNRKVKKLSKLENITVVTCIIALTTGVLAFALNMFIK